MSTQERSDGAQQSGYRSLPQPIPHGNQPFPLVNTSQLHAAQHRTASLGDIYSPIHQRVDSVPSGTSQHSTHSSSPLVAGKVAIPNLRTSKLENAKLSKKGRTSHACDACRKAKAGCSGGHPCARCRSTRSACVYGDGKRDRERKELTKLSRETQYLSTQNSEFKDSLIRIRQSSDLDLEGMKAAIDGLLAKRYDLESPNKSQGSPATTAHTQTSEHDEIEDGDEEDGGAEVGSIGSLDETAVDTDRPENKGIGHLGKASNADWQHRTVEIATNDLRESGNLYNIAPPPIVSTYHTEDADLEYFDTAVIDNYALPDPQLSGDLVQSYFDNVGSVLPILDSASFLSKYRSFNRNIMTLSTDDTLWLATLNCVFAISAYHGRLTKNPHLGNVQDHLIYSARATSLCAQQNILLQDAGITSTTLVALLALYYLSTNRVNKAWTLCGLAFKNAIALGLHVKSVSKNLSEAEREHRVRFFWSLYTLECTLDELTGRPACIADRDIGTPLPMNIEDLDLRTGASSHDAMEGVQSQNTSNSSGSRRDSRASDPAATFEMPTSVDRKRARFSSKPFPLTSSTFFIYRVQLTILAHQSITQLYCASTAKEKWAEIERVMQRINESLVTWADDLPAEFSVKINARQNPDMKDPYTLKRTSLALFYNAARMTLFRPCLCPSKDHTHSQSKQSKDFSQSTVEGCIGAARNIIAILSLYTDSPQLLFSIPPFWNTLHCLCEALAVLLLELALKCEHVPQDKLAILSDIKQGVRWLVNLSAQSISARKAWEIFDKLLYMTAKINHLPVNDMPTQAPVPPGYNFFKHSNSQHHQANVQQHTQAQSLAADVAFVNPNLQENFVQQPWVQSGYEFYDNPLDDAGALERFMGLGQLHGQFDDPWQQHFTMYDATGMMQPQGESLMNLDMGVGGMVSQGSMGPPGTTQMEISPRTGFVAPTYNNNIYSAGPQGRF